jgi:hypothetical protein
MVRQSSSRRLTGQELLDALDTLGGCSAREIMLATGYTSNNKYDGDSEGLKELAIFRAEFAKAYLKRHGHIKRLAGTELLAKIDNTRLIAERKLLPLSMMYTYGTFAFESLLACGYTRISGGRLIEDREAFRAELRSIGEQLDQESKRSPKEIARLTGQELLDKINALPSDTPKDQVIEACGYYTLDNKKKKKDYAAYNQAVVEALREAGIYSKKREEDEKPKSTSLNSGKILAKESQPLSLPAWAMEEIEEMQEDGSSDKSSYSAANKAQPGIEPSNKKSRLKGIALVREALSLYMENTPETSICIRCGYKTDDIGQFRGAFARAAGVAFGPLGAMITEFNASNREVDLEAIYKSREVARSTVQLRQRDAGFREQVLARHGARCLCCEIDHPDLLEAAHIVPVASDGVDKWQNGIPLCPTHHCAFDKHLYAFEPESRQIIAAQGISLERIGVKYKELSANVDMRAIAERYRLFRSQSSQHS